MDTSSIERAPVAPRYPTWVLGSAAVIASLVLCFVVAEIVLHILPVASGLRSLPVDAENPIFHFEPNRSFVFSHGWNLRDVNRGRVNNAGWVNEQDYRKDDATPLIAVVGDSFIEAQIVPFADTMQGRLAKALAGEFRVYSFAASGAPLSQYLIWARHAVHDYGARAVVVNVVLNDFDESHISYKGPPGFWLYVPDAEGELQLRLIPHRRGLLWTLAQKSAIARYLLINLKLSRYILDMPALHSIFIGAPAHAQTQFPANGHDARRLEDSLAVIDAFMRDLPRLVELPPSRVILTVDGFRDPEKARAGLGSYFDRMRKTLLAKASAQGYEAIDLDPSFFARRRETGEEFYVPDDGHWNAAGHGVAAAAVMSSRLLRELRVRR
jgi:hypothetical protein